MGCIPKNKTVSINSLDANNEKLPLKLNESVKRELSLRINSSCFIKEANDNPFDYYELISKLGEGGYGKVYRGRWMSNPVAVKTYLKAGRIHRKSLDDFLK